MKAGALHFCGSVYILPYNEDNFEFLQWLTNEIKLMGGESSFLKVKNIETIKNNEIKDLFNQERQKEYKVIEKVLNEIERKVQYIKRGLKNQGIKTLLSQVNKLHRELEEIKKIDFFNTELGNYLSQKIEAIKAEINASLSFDNKEEKSVEIVPKSIEEFKGKIWVTRKNPFVDRMASAWLIKRFIDKDAVFDFRDENALEGLDERHITFDIQGGYFTHIGDMCTFEVFLKTFKLKDKALKKIAEIVHEIDLKDGKYLTPEAKGIEEILIGIRKTTKDDHKSLEKGIAVFDMLYASFS